MSLAKLTSKNYAGNFIVAIIIVLCCLNSVMSKTLSEHIIAAHDETSLMQSHQQGLVTGASVERNANRDEKTRAEKTTPLARAMAQLSNQLSEDKDNQDKTLNLDITELKDNNGLVYLGGKVSAAELSGYLEQLKNQLGAEQYAIYRGYQAARDQQSFHVTLINPYEYQTIAKARLTSFEQFRVILHGLGRVGKADKTSYFVVASSSDGQYIRQNLLLKNKDFHITLGFYPEDIYGVSKGRETLIKPSLLEH